MKLTVSDAPGICLIVFCLAALGYQMDRARRFESVPGGYSVVFPFGWKALPHDDPALRAEPDAYFGDGRGPTVALFAHIEPSAPKGAAESILAQVKAEGLEVEIKERRRFQRDGAELERFVFYEGQSAHHYTFAFKDGRQIVMSASCAKAEFANHMKKFDSIADSLKIRAGPTQAPLTPSRP